MAISISGSTSILRGICIFYRKKKVFVTSPTFLQIDSKTPSMGYLAFHHCYPETGDKAQGCKEPREATKGRQTFPTQPPPRDWVSDPRGELPCDPVTGEVDLPSAPLKTWELGALPRPPRKPSHHQRTQPCSSWKRSCRTPGACEICLDALRFLFSPKPVFLCLSGCVVVLGSRPRWWSATCWEG